MAKSQIVVYPGVTEFIDFFRNRPRNRSVINKLLSLSFPKFFNSKNIFDQFKALLLNKKIKNSDIVTFIIYDGALPIAFAQILKEKSLKKSRMINLCRNQHKTYKGYGVLLIKKVLHYAKSFLKQPKLYLSVSAMNRRLQNYYSSLGWVNSFRYSSSDEPEFEFEFKLNQD